MAKHGRGSVYWTPSGWRAQITVSGARKSLGRWPTEQKAWAVIHAYFDQLGSAASGSTLLAFGERWFIEREIAGRVRGTDRERSVWRNHVATAPFATMPIHRIERRHVAKWAKSLLNKEALDAITVGTGAERTTVHRRTGRKVSRQVALHALRILRSCLRDAADEGLIAENPAIDVRIPKTAPRDPAWTWLTLEEIDAILTCDRLDQASRDLFAVAIYTGLRKSELWRLRWEHIELEGDRPRVHIRGAAKSQSAIREVPLLPPAREALLRTRGRGGVRRAKGLVWPSATGGERSDSADAGWADRRTRRSGELVVALGAKSRAGIERKVRFHDLRHTCASHLVMGSWLGRPLSLREVMEWMGHSEIGVTQRYAHLEPEGLHGAAQTFKLPERSHQDRTS